MHFAKHFSYLAKSAIQPKPITQIQITAVTEPLIRFFGLFLATLACENWQSETNEDNELVKHVKGAEVERAIKRRYTLGIQDEFRSIKALKNPLN